MAEIVVKTNYPEVRAVTGKTIPEFIWERVEEFPNWKDAEALVCGVSGKSLTFQELRVQSKRFGAALKSPEVGLEGDMVGMLLPNCPQFLVAMMGILDVGLIASPMNASYKPAELKHLLDITKPSCIVTCEPLLPVVLGVKPLCPYVKTVICIGGTGHPETLSFEHLVDTVGKSWLERTSFLNGSDIDTTTRTALVLFSSGTTGLPKGVMLTHSNICTNLWQQAMMKEDYAMKTYVSEETRERLISILPFFHSYGITACVLYPLYQGAKVMTVPKFDPKGFIKAMRTLKPTFWHLVPPLINFVIHCPEITPEDFASTHTVICGAASLGDRLIGKFNDKFKSVFFNEGFGMTEMSPVTHIIPVSSNHGSKNGSIGVLLCGTEARVVDQQTGKDLGSNEPGEMWLKGPQMMKGYYKNEKATNDMIDKNGWLHTGDIVRYDEDGYFYMVDRLKEIIKTKGFQVSPSELENVIRDIPGVVDVAVIGVIKNGEEVPRAYVVRGTPSITETSVEDFVKERVSDFKRLRGGVAFVEAIPKSAAGKILRKDLAQLYATESEN